MRPRPHQLAARAHELLDQTLDQCQRVRGMPVLADQHAAHVVARQGGLQLAQFVGVELVDLDPVLAPQIPGEPVLLQAFGRAVDIEMAETMDEILGACRADQRLQCFEGRPDERAQGAGRRPRLFRRAGANEPQQPRSERRQIAPAQRQRGERVKEPARNVPHDAGHRHRGDGRAVEAPGVAEGCAAAGLVLLDQKDTVAVALQPTRRAHPDHAGPDHADPLCPNCRHRLSSAIDCDLSGHRRRWKDMSSRVAALDAIGYSSDAERCRSGRTGRSRKPLSLLRGTEGSNPSLSARNLRLVRLCSPGSSSRCRNRLCCYIRHFNLLL